MPPSSFLTLAKNMRHRKYSTPPKISSFTKHASSSKFSSSKSSSSSSNSSSLSSSNSSLSSSNSSSPSSSNSNTSSPSSNQSRTPSVEEICGMALNSFDEKPKTASGPPTLSLPKLNPEAITLDKAATVVSRLAMESGSMVAVSFFKWCISSSPLLRNTPRFYIQAATSIITNNHNIPLTNLILHLLLTNMASINKLPQAFHLLLRLHSPPSPLPPLSTSTLNSVLSLSVRLSLLPLSLSILTHMSSLNLPLDSHTHSLMLLLYSSNHSINLPQANHWATSILQHNLLPTPSSLTSFLSALSLSGYPRPASSFLRRLTALGFSPNLIHFTSIIHGFCALGLITRAFSLLHDMVSLGLSPNVHTHTVIIHGLCAKKWTDKAFRLFLKLVRSDTYKPNVYTYTAMINGYCREGRINRAEMLLSRMKEQGLSPNQITYTTLIHAHSKSNNFARAFQLLTSMSSPTICTYNSIAHGLFKKGRSEEARLLLVRAMEKGVDPDEYTYSMLMGEYGRRKGGTRMVLALLGRMEKKGVKPDIHCYTSVMAAMYREGRMEEGEEVLREAERRGVFPNDNTFTTLISGYCRRGRGGVEKGVGLLKRMGGVDRVAYGAVVSALCKEGEIKEARKLYGEMVKEGVSPCEVTRVTVVYEMCRRGEVEEGVEELKGLKGTEWGKTMNSVVRKLCYVGMVEEAGVLLRKMVERGEDEKLRALVTGVTLMGFMAACYEKKMYSLVSDISHLVRASGMMMNVEEVVVDGNRKLKHETERHLGI